MTTDSEVTSNPSGGALSRASGASVLWLTLGAVGLLIIVALSALVLVSRELHEARVSHADAERTRIVLQTVQRLLSTLREAESAERGFVITGDEAYLEPFHRARVDLGDELKQLQVLSIEGDQLDGLASTAASQFAASVQVIDVRRGEGREAAEALIREQVGRQRMADIRALGARISEREERLLSQRVEQFRTRAARSESIVRAALFLAVLIVLLAGALLLRHTRGRLRAEQNASAAHAVLEATVANISQGVAVFDQRHRLEVWNDEYLALRGLRPEYVREGMPLDELVRFAESLFKHTVESGELLPVVPEQVGNGTEFDFEARRTGGGILQVRGRPMPGGGHLVTLLDITAMKRSEAAYRDQAVRLSAIVDNVVDAIVTINESGSIESWSKGAERMFGYEAHEVLRHDVRMLLPEPYRSANDTQLRDYFRVSEQQLPGQRREMEVLTKHGARLPVDLGTSEMQLGNRRMLIAIVRDLSVRREIEQLKAGFVSTVSHELRTPLTSIAGSLGLLAGGVGGALPAKASRLIDIAKLNCERLVLLINDILDLERAEAGRLELHLEQQPLLPVVEQAIELNRAFAHNYSVTLELDTRSETTAEEAMVLIDRDRFIQVVTNLLSNAIKFSPAGEQVRVALELDGDSARVWVRDRGPGISEEFRERIFQRFAQADSSDSRAKGGTGLGLSIAKAIIEKLGGHIGFESNPGEGASFYVTLPLRAPTVPLSGEGAGEGVSHAVPSVLICEDDPDIAQVLRDVLGLEGIRATIAPTAHDARLALEHQRFDLALVDLHLPDADGLDFIAQLRASEPTQDLPVIVMTASARTQSDRREVSALELADWLHKPIDPRRLLTAIRSALSVHRSERRRILHVEDDDSLTQLVRELLEDCEVMSVHTLADARIALRNRSFDLVILDIGLADGSGLDVLPMLRRSDRPGPPVILYSASEATREVSQLVEAALVKSRHSVEQLLANVRTLAKRTVDE